MKAKLDEKFDLPTIRKLLKGDIMALEEIKFESGSSTIKRESMGELRKLLRFMEDHPEMAVNIFGHTDSVGDANRNMSLSDRRAKAISDYLTEHGIPKDRLNPRGFGENFPIASNSTSGGRLKNRRVEVYFFRHIP